MSTQTTNILQSEKLLTFASNVVAGVVASVLVLWGQLILDSFNHYVAANPNIMTNSGFIWIIILAVLPLIVGVWGFYDAKKPGSGRSNKSVAWLMGAMLALFLIVGFFGYAMMTLQAAVNQQNGH